MGAALALTWVAVAMAAVEVPAALLAHRRQRAGFPRRIRPRLDPTWLPRCAIIIPTKGAGRNLAANLGAHLVHDYPDYEVIFAIEDEADEGLPVLREIVARSGGSARIVVAGLASRCSQQNFNMIAGAAAARGAEVLAFCDNDVAPARDWLRALVLTLSDPAVAVGTGYRWHVAPRGTVGELIHTFTNMTMYAHFSLVAQMSAMGVWGGSFALRRTDYEQWGVAAVWGETISDDMGLMAILRARRLRTLLTPDVLLVTEDTLPTARAAIAWYARQLLNLKSFEPVTWLASGMATAAGALLVLWLPVAAGAALAGGSFLAWGGGAALLWWGVELTLVLLYARLGPTYHLGRMLACLPLLRPAQAAAFVASIGVHSLVWAGVRYRFDRRGRVVEITRGVASAEG